MMSTASPVCVENPIVCTGKTNWMLQKTEESENYDKKEMSLVYISAQEGEWRVIYELWLLIAR